MTLTTGQILNNRYRIARLLGQGGFGAVYKAWDITLNRPCALKESFELGAEAGRQFLREAQILANLSHPNLPRVTDFFTVPAVGQYLVMDFVEGQDLEALLAQSGGKLPEAQALGYISQACEALEYLHSQQPPVIHRDIKPANIKIAPPDKYYPQGRVMLVDFGVAKLFDMGTKTTLGARAVTPGYSPYEQYGQGTTDARSDIYALGATLYTLLTGQAPAESVQRVVRDPLVPPRQLEPGISPAVETAILRAMQMDPELRFQTAAEFKDALHRCGYLHPPAVGDPTSTAHARRPGQYGSPSPLTPLPCHHWCAPAAGGPPHPLEMARPGSRPAGGDSRIGDSRRPGAAPQTGQPKHPDCGCAGAHANRDRRRSSLANVYRHANPPPPHTDPHSHPHAKPHSALADQHTHWRWVGIDFFCVFRSGICSNLRGQPRR